MTDVAQMLSDGILGSTVVNTTGLSGRYDFTLDYSKKMRRKVQQGCQQTRPAMRPRLMHGHQYFRRFKNSLD